MAAFTSKATGNWSASGQTTWNEVGVPASGDTVTIAAHTVTVDVNTTVGTSPNDTTTKVINISSASGVLKVAAGVTLTVLGNRGAVNGSTFQQEAGSTVTFDNSGSGGSPVYTDVNGGFTKYIFNGSVGSLATIQAISGKTFTLNGNWSLFTGTYFEVLRGGALTIANVSGSITMSDGIFDACGQLNITSTGTTINFIFDRVTFQNSTHATQSFTFSDTNTYSSGTRRVSGCIFDKIATIGMTNVNLGDGTLPGNYFGAGLNGTSTDRFNSTIGNIFAGPMTNNASAGIRFNKSASGNYFLTQGTTGNPHYAQVWAMDGNVSFTGNVFEQADVYAVDGGDCVFPYDNGGGYIITIDNNLVLPNSVSGQTASAGSLVTAYSGGTIATRTFRCRHNTVCVTNPGAGNGLAAVDLSEGQAGHAGEMSEWKSNLCWSADGTGTQVARLFGTVNGVLTAAGADYNWRWGINLGDNGLGYDDWVGNLDLWTGVAATGGNAAAAGVDAHGGSGDPKFVDSTRNIAKWCAARGYGVSTTAAGLVALKADLTRVSDLITYVQGGFAPTNPSLHNAGHDGVTIGAVEYVSVGGGSVLAGVGSILGGGLVVRSL